MYGLYLARELHPEAMLYFSEEAHYSILNMPHTTVKRRADGEIDYDDLRNMLTVHQDRPAIILATIGTTMRGAVDDIPTIRQIINELHIEQHYIHADAALSGMILPYVDDPQPFGFDAGIHRCRSTSSGRPRCRPSVAGRISPALATRRWSSKAIWMRSGWSSASIFWVLLAWGRFPVSKAIIPDGQEHFLTPSAHRDTHLFGGLGLRQPPRQLDVVMTCHSTPILPKKPIPSNVPPKAVRRSAVEAPKLSQRHQNLLGARRP